MPQIMTLLDLRCITGMGVTKGSSLRFQALAEMPMRFGSGAGASSTGAAAEAAEQEAAMEALAEALKAREEAEEEERLAQRVCFHLGCSDSFRAPGSTQVGRLDASKTTYLKNPVSTS